MAKVIVWTIHGSDQTICKHLMFLFLKKNYECFMVRIRFKIDVAEHELQIVIKLAIISAGHYLILLHIIVIHVGNISSWLQIYTMSIRQNPVQPFS